VIAECHGRVDGFDTWPSRVLAAIGGSQEYQGFIARLDFGPRLAFWSIARFRREVDWLFSQAQGCFAGTVRVKHR
jgi:hypothetical protein